MIKIRHMDLSEGLHVEVKSDGAKTIICLAPALTRGERRAALTKARQAARVGRTVPLGLVPLALAIGADRVKITLRSAAAAARVHPVSFAVPAALVITAVILYTFVTSVTIHLSRPRAVGPGGAGAATSAAPAPSPGSPQPAPVPGKTIGTGGSRGQQAGRGGRGQQHAPPARMPVPISASQQPMPSPSPNTAATSPAPSPAPSSSGGSGAVCIQIGSIQVCAHLRASV